MKQFKTQCYLMHETTTKAVRQRQLSFFLLANENNMPLSVGEKAKIQQVYQHSDSSGLETTRCQEPSKGMVQNTDRGLALVLCLPCYIRTSIKLSSIARRDQFLRKIK